MDTLEMLAERVNKSKTTVANYLKWLSGESKSSKKRYFRVVPHLNEGALDLYTVDVFFETPTHEELEAVERLCDAHPYTKYRARSYGGSSELFAQFRIPKGTMSLLKRFLDRTKKESVFSDYRILPTEEIQPIFSVPQLEFWNQRNFTWDFDWSRWFELDGGNSEKRGAADESKLNLLTRPDMSILSSISTGGIRRKQKDIMNELKSKGVEFTSQEFSRRLQLLKDHFITQYHVYLDIDAFDLYSNVIITGHCDTDFSKMFKARLLHESFPFRSTLRIKDDFMFWYLRLPPSHLSKLLDYLHHHLDNLRLSTIDYEKTAVYGLWDEAFDEDRAQWRVDENFMMC